MIADIIDRLKTRCPSLTSVGEAEDIDAITKGTAPRSGACFVIPFVERPLEDNQFASGAFRQLLEVRTLIAFLVRRHDDAKGGKRVGLYDLYKGEIETAMAGWELTPESGPFQHAGAQGQPLGNGTTIYVQTWKNQRYLEA